MEERWYIAAMIDGELNSGVHLDGRAHPRLNAYACYNTNVTKSHFIVSLSSDLRPLVARLNRALAGLDAEPVLKEELPEIDRILHEDSEAPGAEATRCPRCHGYISLDLDGELICLNCGRPAAPTRTLDDVVQKIAQMLIDLREERWKRTKTEASEAS